MIHRALLAVAQLLVGLPDAREVKGDDPDKREYPSPPSWELGERLATPPLKN
jgi:hypothetical protein